MTEAEVLQQELAIYKMVVRNQSITIDMMNKAIDGLAQAAKQAYDDFRFYVKLYESAEGDVESAYGRLEKESAHNQELIEQNDALCNDLTAIAEIVKVWQ